MIKNIVFDIGMVLIDFHWDKTMRELGIPEEAIEHLGKHMIHHSLWSHLDKNDIPESEIIDEFKKISPEYSGYIDIFFRNMEGVVTDYPKSAEWLKKLKERGYNIYLLSNYPERMFKMHSVNYSFMPYVDGKVVSYECKLTKPDRKIYELLCDRYDIKPEESVFLDDRQENIDAAKQMGFEGIVVENQDDAIIELDKILAKRINKAVTSFIEDNSEEKYKDFYQSLSPESVKMSGVRIPLLRNYAKILAKGDYRLYLENANSEWTEERLLQGFVIGYAKMSIDEALYYFDRFRPLICDWSICDTVCATFKIAKKNLDRVWDYLMGLVESEREFDQRVVAVMLMDYFMVDDYIDKVLEIYNRLSHPGYYRMMGVAWGVATAYAKYPEKTKDFLLNNRLDDITYNKAIQKMIESYRVSEEDKLMLRRMKRR